MSDSRSAQGRTAWARGHDEPRDDYGLEPAPIRTEWLLEGSPVTRCRILSGSTDDRAFTAMWDCTAGRFHWYYDVDETIYVLEGSVIVTDPQGQRHTLQAMDTYLFPAGTRYHWNIPVYVRKLAFIHLPLPKKLRFARRVYRSVKGWFGTGKQDAQQGGGAGAALRGG
jgi:hypothetical protein